MRQWLTKFLLKVLWKLSDDPTHTFDYMHNLYNDVPKELQNEWVSVHYFYVYKDKNRKQILEWIYKNDD